MAVEFSAKKEKGSLSHTCVCVCVCLCVLLCVCAHMPVYAWVLLVFVGGVRDLTANPLLSTPLFN